MIKKMIQNNKSANTRYEENDSIHTDSRIWEKGKTSCWLPSLLSSAGDGACLGSSVLMTDFALSK